MHSGVSLNPYSPQFGANGALSSDVADDAPYRAWGYATN